LKKIRTGEKKKENHGVFFAGDALLLFSVLLFSLDFIFPRLDIR
jgi:hypothetical protein